MRTLVGAAVVAAMTGAAGFVPARRLGGAAPPLPPPSAVGWLEETVDLAVDASGRVRDVVLLRGTMPPPNLLVPAAATWRFRAATLDNRRVGTHVLAVGLFRPPQIFDQPTLGSAPVDVKPAPDELPYPIATRRPRYPPLAAGESVVLVEALVGTDGRVREASVVQGASGFSEEALLTAREWAFRPARRNGENVPAYVYLAFAFRQPVS